MNTGTRNSDSTIIIDRVDSLCNSIGVIRFADIEKRLIQQYSADYDYLKRNYAEQNKLRPVVRKYQDLEREAKVRQERVARIIAVLGEDQFTDMRKEQLSGTDISKDLFFDSEDLPLWELMKAIVEQVTEIQVVELQAALEHFHRKVSRQAVESALASHRETFETKTRNREKFVSLKQ